MHLCRIPMICCKAGQMRGPGLAARALAVKSDSGACLYAPVWGGFYGTP